jgi:hypothetical protein
MSMAHRSNLPYVARKRVIDNPPPLLNVELSVFFFLAQTRKADTWMIGFFRPLLFPAHPMRGATVKTRKGGCRLAVLHPSKIPETMY